MPRFDRRLLAPAELEFVVLADTHDMADPGDAAVEFASRRRQSARARAAWSVAAALDPAFVVHMGDIVQEFPERPGFPAAVDAALAQAEAAGLRERCRFVAGNHDVGDKPDPTMPTEDVTEASLAAWHDRVGPSWTSWEAAGVRFLVLDSQILNTGLAAEAEQARWLEAELAAWPTAAPLVVFLHLPPFLDARDEPWLGHYDNIGEPGRGWLLERLRGRRVLGLFAAHVHFRFAHRLAACGVHGCEPGRYLVVPSTAFTRPGFGHLFTSAAPPERGRDDVDKLGLFLCRLVQGRLEVHLVRTGDGALGATDDETLVQLTPVAPGPPGATGTARAGGLGVTARHPLTPAGQVPLAWPSAVRQPVRNHYPRLACLELGAGWVRVPACDLADPVQAGALADLRAEGLRVQVMALGEAEAARVAAGLGSGDVLEVQLPGRRAPDVEALRALGGGGGGPAAGIVLCPVRPGQPVPGKQHARTRVGYLPEELAALGEELAAAGLAAHAAVRLDPADPAAAVTALAAGRPAAVSGVVLLAELPATDDGINAAAAARAVAAAAALGAPLFLEPLVDLDRTMDVADGLLDTLCNPRPAFHVARHLAACLAAGGATRFEPRTLPAGQVIDLGAGGRLLLPGAPATLGEWIAGDAAPPARVCCLAEGTLRPWAARHPVDPAAGPLLELPPA